jgi:hypothetical protein
LGAPGVPHSLCRFPGSTHTHHVSLAPPHPIQHPPSPPQRLLLVLGIKAAVEFHGAAIEAVGRQLGRVSVLPNPQLFDHFL